MIRRALRYMYPEDERWPLIAASVACSAAMAIAVYAPQATAEVGPSQRVTPVVQEDEPGWDCLRHGNRMCGTDDPDRVLCGSPNIVVTHSECEAYLLEDAQTQPEPLPELPKTL